jgi:hypothetical protein
VRTRIANEPRLPVPPNTGGIRLHRKDTQLTELYKLHTPFVVAFLAFVVVFVVVHARR